MNATAVKSGNYPQEVIDTMVSEYTANPTRATVAALAEQFNKTERSVIAKLSSLEVYVAQPKPTKRPPQVRKADFVAQIESALEMELPSLSKAGFGDLEKNRWCFEQLRVIRVFVGVVDPFRYDKDKNLIESEEKPLTLSPTFRRKLCFGNIIKLRISSELK